MLHHQKVLSRGEGATSDSTKASDFVGSPRPSSEKRGTTVDPRPTSDSVERPSALPCDIFIEPWLSGLDGTRVVGGALAANHLLYHGSSLHRERRGFPLIPLACIARSLNRKEIQEHPKARQSLQQEWDRLRSRRAWARV
jgi:hypothetical protein